MAHIVKVIGVKEIKQRLRKAHVSLGSSVEKGLTKAGLFVQRASMAIVPIEFGILKNSAGTKIIGKGWDTDVVVYYTASYAVYVHENKKAKHKPGKKAKFLEGPARENRERILRMIAGVSLRAWKNQYGSGG